MLTTKVIIIGGGPAGLSAGIYLGRAGFSPLIFAGSPPGGQLMLTSEVENFPGNETILGAELIERMRQQAIKFGATVVDENVKKVDFSKKQFKVYSTGSATKFLSHESLPAKTRHLESEKISFASPENKQNLTIFNDLQPFTTNSVLIATGASALWLNITGEQRLRGKGVSACATCDGFFFRDKVVAVVGGGDTALEEALTLTKFAKKVYIIHRRDSFRASKIMQERVMKNTKIEIIWNAIVEEVLGEKRVEGIRVKINPKSKILNPKQILNSNNKNSKQKSLGSCNLENLNLFRNSNLEFRILSVDGVFVAIGHKPDTEIFREQIEMDEKGYVITSERAALENIKYQKSKIKNTSKISNIFNIKKYNFNFKTMTSVEGVFAAGDCVDFEYRQAGTAAGQGIAAALEIEKYLESS